MLKLVVLAAACLLAMPAQAEQCSLTRLAALDMTETRGGHVAVPMSIAGQSVSMIVDTGGLVSMLTPKTVTQLGLKPQTMILSAYQMYGGKRIDYFASAENIDLGGLKAAHKSFFILPDESFSDEAGGILGPEILQVYDDEFDFAGGKFNLFYREHCPGQVVYWTHDPYAHIPFHVDEGGHITFPVTLDGHTITVVMDTGSPTSVMDLRAAKIMFGIADDSPDLTPAGGTSQALRYPFQSMTFGDIAVSHPNVVLIPYSESRDDSRMILGLSVLRQLHMYISYKEHMLYLTSATAR